MKVKKELDYALRALVHLTRAENQTASSKAISKEEKIPRDYLIQIFQHLRNAEMVTSTPGKHGGYCLARDAREITVLDVVGALDGLDSRVLGLSGASIVVADAVDRVLADLSIGYLSWARRQAALERHKELQKGETT